MKHSGAVGLWIDAITARAISTCHTIGSYLVSILKSSFFVGADGRVQWETLVTGLAAVIVAWITVSQIRAQIRQTDLLAQESRTRRHRAARATLPLALSELYDYARDCIGALHDLKPLFDEKGLLDRSKVTPEVALKIPALPDAILPTLRDCIETGSLEFSEAASELIQFCQIQRVRMTEDFSLLVRHQKTRILMWANIEQAIIDAAELVALAICLFPYARRETDEVFEPNEALIRIALWESTIFTSDAEVSLLVDRWEAEKKNRLSHREIGLKSLGLKPRSAR